VKTGVRFWLMLALLIGASLGLRLVSHGEAISLSKPLSTLPTTLQGWRGADVPIEPRFLQALGVSDYVSRVYRNSNHPPVTVYVGYYKSQRTGQSIHSPKNCLPGGGWEPVSTARIDVNLPNGKRTPVNLYVIENGLRRQVVLYWYQSHGRIIASEYWGKIYMVLDALRLNRTDAALVRVSAPVQGNENLAREEAMLFAQRLMFELPDLLPQ
jgi:EpsI family protein